MLGLSKNKVVAVQDGPNAPDPSDPPHADSGREQPVDAYEEALDAVRLVLAWYTEQIFTERRAAAPDEHRVQELLAAQRECVAAREELRRATPEELARIAAQYATRYEELTGS